MDDLLFQLHPPDTLFVDVTFLKGSQGRYYRPNNARYIITKYIQASACIEYEYADGSIQYVATNWVVTGVQPMYVTAFLVIE